MCQHSKNSEEIFALIKEELRECIAAEIKEICNFILDTHEEVLAHNNEAIDKVHAKHKEKIDKIDEIGRIAVQADSVYCVKTFAAEFVAQVAFKLRNQAIEDMESGKIEEEIKKFDSENKINDKINEGFDKLVEITKEFKKILKRSRDE